MYQILFPFFLILPGPWRADTIANWSCYDLDAGRQEFTVNASHEACTDSDADMYYNGQRAWVYTSQPRTIAWVQKPFGQVSAADIDSAEFCEGDPEDPPQCIETTRAMGIDVPMGWTSLIKTENRDIYKVGLLELGNYVTFEYQHIGYAPLVLEMQ